MSNTITHAKNELEILLGKNPEDGLDKWMKENVLELIEVFSKQGHSGSSAPFVINWFKRLANFENISPLTFKDDEWNNSLAPVHDDTFQNKRMSAVFKQGKDGKPYYIDAITFRTPKGGSWHSGNVLMPDGTKIGSAQYIDVSKPFIPKTFYINVREEEVAPDDWEFHLDDIAQLDDVFKYYNRK